MAGNKLSGRPKGVLNKTTRLAKEAISMAADELGGAERLTEWAKESPENEKAFWVQIYPKLLPLTVQGDPSAPLTVARVLDSMPATEATRTYAESLKSNAKPH